MKLTDFTVGDKLYIRKYKRSSEPPFDIFVGIVKKIGRKYLDVEIAGFNYFTQKFEIDCTYEDRLICVNNGYKEYMAFKNETAAKNYDEWQKLRKWFYNLSTSSTYLSLNQLQKIKEIVGE